MAYRHAIDAEDYSDFAAGKVLYGLPGHTAFPVRLTDEIWGHFLALRERRGLAPGRYTIFDPCCGGAYQLTTLALRHGHQIKHIHAGDININALETAGRNLSLLTPAGRSFRAKALNQLHDQFNKPSHADALLALARLETSAPANPPQTTIYQLDVGQPTSFPDDLKSAELDLILCDVPYGLKANWQGAMAGEPAGSLHTFLENLHDLLSPTTIIALAMSKQQKATHEAYEPLGRFNIGKRRIQFLWARN